MRKYTEEFINNSNILKNCIIGIELEFFLKELSFYKTLEMLNKIMNPVQVYGFREYHPDMKPTKDAFLMTPDLSGGSNMVEVITGPLPYYEAKFYLIKILKFIEEYGYTNENSSIHFNISFSDKDIADLNVLKFILNIDEEEIYKVYPKRKGNVYSKSIKRIIPFKEYDFTNIPINVMKNNIKIPDDKYYGVNFLNINNENDSKRLEYRYIGGKDYEKNIGDLIYFLDKFIILTDNCINANYDGKDEHELEKYLDKNISNFKNFSSYDNFLIEFPTITLQIDQVSQYERVSTYYNRIYEKIYNLIDSTENLNNCIINWMTNEQRLEVVDAEIKCVMNISNFDFINCKIEGILSNCGVVNCEVKDSQLLKCAVNTSEIVNSKMINSAVENSDVKDSFFMDGYFSGNMQGGVLRSGKLGVHANISSTTKIVTGNNNFFDTKFGIDKKSDKGLNWLKK